MDSVSTKSANPQSGNSFSILLLIVPIVAIGWSAKVGIKMPLDQLEFFKYISIFAGC